LAPVPSQTGYSYPCTFRRVGGMAGGFVATPFPSLDEHEAKTNEYRRQIAELRQLNAKHEKHQRELAMSAASHQKTSDACVKSMADLVDRGKFVRVAAAASNVDDSGPAPHEFYQEQAGKIRLKSLTMLSTEAEDFARKNGSMGSSPPSRKTCAGLKRMVRGVPSNFSPFMGYTENHVRKQSDSVLLGLRSSISWQAGKRPGRLPCLLPRDSPHDGHRFASHTGSWMAKVGTLDHNGRSRAHISMMTSTRSSPGL